MVHIAIQRADGHAAILACEGRFYGREIALVSSIVVIDMLNDPFNPGYKVKLDSRFIGGDFVGAHVGVNGVLNQ